MSLKSFLRTYSARVKNKFSPKKLRAQDQNDIFIYFLFRSQSYLYIEALWCKTDENPRDRKSHIGAPLNNTTEVHLTYKSIPAESQKIDIMPVRHVTGTGSGLLGGIPRVVVQISALTLKGPL
jgi:hypothetical protein